MRNNGLWHDPTDFIFEYFYSKERKIIYEIHTYAIKVGTVQEYYKKFHEAFEERQKLSRMIGIFNTEFGDLNRIMHN